MVDWKSPEVIAATGVSLMKSEYAFSGVYFWEWFTSLDFEWQYITRKRAFRWPLIFYFLHRYALLFSLIATVAVVSFTREINCQALWGFAQVIGSMSTGFVSINLGIRTMAVWGQKLYIVVPLVVLIIGHWAVYNHGVLMRAKWDPVVGSCVITGSDQKFITAGFIYAMSYDFIVLCLMWYKLRVRSSGRSRIGNLMFRDGLIYFVVAFMAYLIAVVFMLLDLNPPMQLVGAAPASVASSVVTLRAIRRLVKYGSEGSHVYQGTSMCTMAFTQPGLSVASQKESVCVQVQTFQQTDAIESKDVEIKESQTIY